MRLDPPFRQLSNGGVKYNSDAYYAPSKSAFSNGEMASCPGNLMFGFESSPKSFNGLPGFLTTQVSIETCLTSKNHPMEGQPAQDVWDEALREYVGKNYHILQQVLDAFAQS
ncbi:MAG: hypothetical protein PHR16_11610 [Methylovulum sp.]|nr:hypothetical protein [Methylovulum sp.]